MSRPVPSFPFDAVLFDLDGTLVATERYWPDAAREACLEAFPRLGIEQEIPPASAWMDMVGRPLATCFDEAFPELEPAVRGALMDACVEREHALLAQGRAGLLPGVRATLDALAAAGARIGIASNCSQQYLDVMLRDVGLARWVEEARCLASRGVADKADMVEDLLLTFGTRSAVMVGDRAGDRDAAWANGLPHVHVDRGYASSPERVEAEAVLEGMDQLVPRLREREAWLDRLLARLDPAPGSVLGVTGRTGAGKSLVARDLARRLVAAGQPAVVVSLDDHRRSPEELAARPPARGPADHLHHDYDVAGLLGDLVLPHRAGEPAATSVAGARGSARLVQVPRSAVLVLEGPYLAHPDVAASLDRLLHLVVSDEVALRRVAGRDGRLSGVAAVDRVRRDELPRQAAFERLFAPRDVADVVALADNPLGG